jgi:hypothetical protein
VASGATAGVVDGNAASWAGVKTFSDGVKYATTGGTATTLNYYEEKTFTNQAFAFNGTGGASGDTKTITVSKLGKVVTLYVPALTGTSRTTSTELKASAFLDSRFRPANDQQFPCVSQENGTVTTGYLRVETDGSVSVTKTVTSTAWGTGVASCGLNSGMTVSWLIP